VVSLLLIIIFSGDGNLGRVERIISELMIVIVIVNEEIRVEVDCLIFVCIIWFVIGRMEDKWFDLLNV